ncbi:uncharacterized protein LOC122170133 isoform X3 [Centrocercus urophasianus]|uniref:uncharacterized protein LOC122170133 isoform X3 n=1 Tax=Centrocercus urophasianus TaxID=9002 RepID=UPI001C65386F|nr:uncharacterized protein LOC122170133 isoform X3 [Centrocercus urophasianus]
MLSFRKANFQLFRDSNNRTPCKSVLMSKNAEQRWQTSREALRPQVQQVRKHRQETSVAGAAQAKQKRLRTSISTEARLEMWGRKRREETAGQRSRWPGFTFGSGRLCSVPPECAFLGRFVWRISDVNFSSSAALLWTLSPSISWSGSPSCTQRWRRGRTAQSRAGSRFPGLAVLGLTQPRAALQNFPPDVCTQSQGSPSQVQNPALALLCADGNTLILSRSQGKASLSSRRSKLLPA